MNNRDPFIERWVTEMPDDFRQRVLSRLMPSDGGCLCWQGHTVGTLGYGRVRVPGRLKNPGTAREFQRRYGRSLPQAQKIIEERS